MRGAFATNSDIPFKGSRSAVAACLDRMVGFKFTALSKKQEQEFNERGGANYLNSSEVLGTELKVLMETFPGGVSEAYQALSDYKSAADNLDSLVFGSPVERFLQDLGAETSEDSYISMANLWLAFQVWATVSEFADKAPRTQRGFSNAVMQALGLQPGQLIKRNHQNGLQLAISGNSGDEELQGVFEALRAPI